MKYIRQKVRKTLVTNKENDPDVDRNVAVNNRKDQAIKFQKISPARTNEVKNNLIKQGGQDL